MRYQQEVSFDKPLFTKYFEGTAPPLVIGTRAKHSSFAEDLVYYQPNNSGIVIEAWMLPLTEDATRVGTASFYVQYENKAVSFVILYEDLTTESISIQTPFRKSFYIRASYANGEMNLVVDDTEKRIQVDDERRLNLDQYFTANSTGTRVVLGPIALYTTLGRSHYEFGFDNADSVSAGRSLGGAVAELASTTFEKTVVHVPLNGIIEDGIGGETLRLEGTFLTSVPIVDVVLGSSIYWTGTGQFIVESSYDGGDTWTVCKNGGVIEQLGIGDLFNTVLQIRITAITESEITKLDLVLYTSNQIQATAKLITLNLSEFEIEETNTHQMAYYENGGAKILSPALVTPRDINSPTKTIEFWMKMNVTSDQTVLADTTRSFLLTAGAFVTTGLTAFKNGITPATPPNDGWNHYVLVLDSTSNVEITVGSDEADFNIKGLAFYTNETAPSILYARSVGHLEYSALRRVPRNLFNPAIISNSFETDTLGWVVGASAASLASVVGNASHGTRSMRVTANAAGGTAGATTGFHPCTAGLAYSFSFHATTTLSFQMFVGFYDAVGTNITFPGAGIGAPAGGAGRLSYNNLIAPVGATQLKVFIEGLAVPANGTYHLDAVQYEQAAAATPYDIESAAIIIIPLDNVVIADDPLLVKAYQLAWSES